MSAAPKRSSSGAATVRRSKDSLQALSEGELDELQRLLDAVPAPLEPLDVSMLDGFLCGVLVQPVAVPAGRWMRHVTDADGRALPDGFDTTRLQGLVARRHAELEGAIGRRQWFDPWVFELSDPQPSAAAEDAEARIGLDAVYPWVAGFAAAMELFPQLLALGGPAVTEPIALLYQHLAPGDLEDADELLAEIDSLEPPQDLADAVERLVRATLLLADVSRPPTARQRRAPARGTGRRR
jgi:uncharacterized protein